MARDDFQIAGSKPIGRGAFGTVFAATRLADGQRVALKLVLHSGEWGPERIEAERKGAILQQRFAQSHGMVPEVYDFGADGDDFYIAMEFIDGNSLEGLLRHGKRTPADAAGHAAWLCEFLEKAHAFCGVVDGRSYRIVHTDLKPAHLMVSSDGERRVLDFGIAKALEESRELGTDIARTIAYASPERLVSDQVSPHADFWSLGVMLFEMVCGHRPYPHLEGPRFRRELEHAIASNAPRAALPDSCPAALGAIISKLLAFQVEHRYPTATAIKEDLEAFLRGETPSALTTYETPATTPVQRVGVRPGSDPAQTGVRPSSDRGQTELRPGSDLGPTPTLAAATVPRAPVTIPPTEPVVRVPPAAAAPSAAAAPPAPKRSLLRRIAVGLVMLWALVSTAKEGVAWMFAARFRESIATIDERSVTEHKQAYDAVDRWASMDIGLKALVHPLLYPALVAVGDRVIADYRREEPAMGPSEWEQAYVALTWASQLSHGSRSLRGKQLTAEGHVKRFQAQAAKGSAATLLSQDALASFRKAAEADPESFDPYLGMARVQVYSLSDVDAAATAIDEATKRGYVPGRREAALLGDGYLRRANATWRRLRVLTGEQRSRELDNARSDYERCVTLFDPIVAFGNAAKNLEICKAQLERVEQLKDGLGES
jgi:serine/threonine protein kinase